MPDTRFNASIREASAIALSYGWRVAAFDSIDSTNAEALRAAESGSQPGLVVWALNQTAGRGRLGRTWQSPPGNLYLSILIDVSFKPECAPELSFATALALKDIIAGISPALEKQVTLKWPNDVLMGGAKVGGILLESAGPDAIVIGLGLNLKRPKLRTDMPITGIQNFGQTVKPEAILGLAVRSIHDRVALWAAKGFDPIRTQWLDCAHGIGSPISVQNGDTVIEGIFSSVDEDGALIIEGSDSKTHRILAGDVVYGVAGTAKEA